MQKFVLSLLLIITLTAQAQFKNQNEILKTYTSGNYTVYRNDQGKLEKVNKLWPISFTSSSTKDANGNNIIESILIKRSGVVDELFVPDLKEQPGYYSYEAAKLVFFEGYGVYYKQATIYDGSTQYDIMYEFIPEGGSSRSLKSVPEDIAAYRAAVLNNQGNARATIAKVNEEKEAKEKEQNSLKGKSVKSLKFQAVDIPVKLGLMSKVKFGMIATLADGTELKTKLIGGRTEFEDSYIIETKGCTFADGVLEVGLDAANFPNDEIVLIIKNINNPSQSITEKITLNYASTLFTYSSGDGGNMASSGNTGKGGCPAGAGGSGNAGNRGKDGGDITIKIKEVKHKKTGSTLYEYEIFKARENQTIRMKSTADAEINIICYGGNGSDGGAGGNGGSQSSPCGAGRGPAGNGGAGGNGANGGNVTIIKQSASINTSFFKINNKGGTGGKGGRSGLGSQSGLSGAPGNNGNNGAMNVSVGQVNLNW